MVSIKGGLCQHKHTDTDTFLIKHRQRVLKKLCQLRSLSFGVPQGSVLWPTLIVHIAHIAQIASIILKNVATYIISTMMIVKLYDDKISTQF